MGSHTSLEDNEPNSYSSTPKLSLSKLPSKLRAATPTATPPFNRLASIPFDWEEVPGKRRPDLLFINNDNLSSISSSPLHYDCHKNRRPLPVARCLELPPRLLNATTNNNNSDDAGVVVNAHSPTTVLDGPYYISYYESPSLGRSFSSLPKGSFSNTVMDHLDKELETVGGRMSNRFKFNMSSASWRWPASFKDITAATAASGDMTSTSTSSSPPPSKIGRDNHSSKFFKIKGRRSSSSFFNFSRSRSNFLSGVYGSLKQVVSWKR